VNMSGDPNEEYLSDGITAETTNALARVSGLRIVARTSAFQFKGKAQDVRKIGQQVGADAVL
jgi:adenylate cyclase